MIDIDRYIKLLYHSIGITGIWPMPVHTTTANGPTTYSTYAYERPADLINTIRELIKNDNSIEEFIFGLDTYTEKYQGTTLGTCVLIFHGSRNATKVGVWEYRYNDHDEPTIKQVNWNNRFWTEHYQALLDDMQHWCGALE